MHNLPILEITPRGVVACEWSFVGLATIFVALRMYVRSKDRLFSASDACILITHLCFIITAAFDTIMVSKGFSDESLNLEPGDHESAYVRLPHDLLVNLMKMLYASSVPYYTSLWLVKTTLVLLYYQLIPKECSVSGLRIALHITAVTVGVSYIIMICANMFWCIPLKRNWDVDFTTEESASDPRYCVAYFSMTPYVISVALHVLTEIMVFSLPFPLLRVLKFNKRMFRAVTAVFAVGFVGVLVSLGRVAYTFMAEFGPVISIWQAWASIEQSVGIVVCCLPALKKLIKSVGDNDNHGGSDFVDLDSGNSAATKISAVKNEGSVGVTEGWPASPRAVV